MEVELRPHASTLKPESRVTADELADLQDVCSRIAASGGEVGEISTEIARISRELNRLTCEIDEFLAS